MTQVANHGALRQREPRVRDREHLARVARLPCVACLIRRGVKVWPVHVAHIRAGYPEAGWRPTGAAEKPSDVRSAPLCPSCHLTGPDAQHGMNEREWWEELGVYPPAFCAGLRGCFDKGQTGEAALYLFVMRARETLAARRR